MQFHFPRLLGTTAWRSLAQVDTLARTWQAADFVNNQMPTQLDGVSVTVNGKSAYVCYISPTQVNILIPPDPIQGAVVVQVTNNGLLSEEFSVQAKQLSPSFFVLNGGPYVVAQHGSNYSLIGPTRLYLGLEQIGQRVRRTMIEETGVRPEDLPSGPDIREVRRGLKNTNKGFGRLDNVTNERKQQALETAFPEERCLHASGRRVEEGRWTGDLSQPVVSLPRSSNRCCWRSINGHLGIALFQHD